MFISENCYSNILFLMRPIQIVYFIAIVLCGLLFISYIFPKDGIPVTDNFALEFPTIDEFLEDSVQKQVDISEILKKNDVETPPTDSEIEQIDTLTKIEENVSTAMLNDSVEIKYKPVAINPKDVTCKLEFPPNNKKLLDNFFAALANLPNNRKVVRILHYGDSQIEQDRISSVLRYKFQKQFGGSGPGLVTPVQSYGFSVPVVSSYSDGWQRFAGFGRRNPNINHNRYGVLVSFGQYGNNFTTDSTAADTIIHHEWLKFQHSPYSSSLVKRFSSCRMFYGFNSKPVEVSLLINNQVKAVSTLPTSNSLQVKKWNFDNTPSNFQFNFDGKGCPEVYAFTLDGSSGVILDNIPLRGSSGYIFTNSNTAILQGIYQNLNAKLIIMQFGGNMAVSNSKDYSHYEYSFSLQLKKLKRLMPNVSIIVMGMADMSMKDKDRYVSKPSVKLVRNALRNAAFKSGCAFWDTYKAMGGENSMPSWVFAEPALANKDFVHFTAKGARVIGQMFYKAILLEYNNYLRKK